MIFYYIIIIFIKNVLKIEIKKKDLNVFYFKIINLKVKMQVR